MARSNKYTSLNFNGFFEKKLNNNQPATNNPSVKSFTNQSKTALPNSRIHGHMLVLTRPAPKPISIPQKSENIPEASSVSSPPPSDPAQAGREPDSISLHPQGQTRSAPVLNSSPLPSPVSPLPSKFVPPHLRPGFVGKEEKPGPELVKVGFKGKPEIRGPRPGEIQDPGHYRPIKLISLIVSLSLFSLLLSASFLLLLLRHRHHHEPLKTGSLRLFPPDTAPTTTVDITKKPG